MRSDNAADKDLVDAQWLAIFKSCVGRAALLQVHHKECKSVEEYKAALEAVLVRPVSAVTGLLTLRSRVMRPGKNVNDFFRALWRIARETYLTDVRRDEEVCAAFVSGH